MRNASSLEWPSPPDGYWFDDEAADRVCDFFAECIRHVKGQFAGRPFVLEPWQRQATRELFGWKRPDGSRRYRTGFVEVPRKNGKTTWLGGIGLYLLCADDEAGAEIFSCAGDRDQASIIYDIGKRMVELEPALLDVLIPFRKAMHYPPTDAWWRVLSADAGTKHGYNPHGVLFDELHVQPNRELWDVMTSGQGSRHQPLTLAITTAGFDRHSICFEQYDYAQRVTAGVIEDPSFFALIFEADTEDDWEDREVWKKANPNLGVSLSMEYLEDQFAKAKASPSAQNTFRRLHLNQWTQQRDRWLDLAEWDACAGEMMPAEIESAAAGRPCYFGLDLASSIDIAGLVGVFVPEDEDAPLDVLCRFFVPEENAYKRGKRDRVPYEAWAREGWLTLTEGNVIDYRVIRREVHRLAERYEMRELAFDRWNAAQLISHLEEDGIRTVGFGQGFKDMSSPTHELMHLVMRRGIRHGGHPVLRWMADNLVTKEDPAGNIKPDKGKSIEKIDGMVALIMAIGRAIANEGEVIPSRYDAEGLRVL